MDTQTSGASQVTHFNGPANREEVCQVVKVVKVQVRRGYGSPAGTTHVCHVRGRSPKTKSSKAQRLSARNTNSNTARRRRRNEPGGQPRYSRESKRANEILRVAGDGGEDGWLTCCGP